MDVDQERGIVYVHWIDVKTTEPEEARRLIAASLEEKIAAWLVE
jgi:multisubunit Na+/H+ antiporter MnhE subunit